MVVVVVAAHSSSCSPGTHLHRQIDGQAPINKPNVIASPRCQLQVAQTSKEKGPRQLTNKTIHQSAALINFPSWKQPQVTMDLTLLRWDLQLPGPAGLQSGLPMLAVLPLQRRKRPIHAAHAPRLSEFQKMGAWQPLHHLEIASSWNSAEETAKSGMRHLKSHTTASHYSTWKINLSHFITTVRRSLAVSIFLGVVIDPNEPQWTSCTMFIFSEILHPASILWLCGHNLTDAGGGGGDGGGNIMWEVSWYTSCIYNVYIYIIHNYKDTHHIYTNFSYTYIIHTPI